MFTHDEVDWNQIPPDNNTGIQFPVQLAVDGGLTGSNAHVVENKTANVTSRDECALPGRDAATAASSAKARPV